MRLNRSLSGFKEHTAWTHYLTLNNNPSADPSWTNPLCLRCRSSFPLNIWISFFPPTRSLNKIVRKVLRDFSVCEYDQSPGGRAHRGTMNPSGRIQTSYFELTPNQNFLFIAYFLFVVEAFWRESIFIKGLWETSLVLIKLWWVN